MIGAVTAIGCLPKQHHYIQTERSRRHGLTTPRAETITPRRINFSRYRILVRELFFGEIACKKFVGFQKKRKSPKRHSVIASTHLPLIVDDAAFQHVGLLNSNVLVQRQLRARLPAKQHG